MTNRLQFHSCSARYYFDALVVLDMLKGASSCDNSGWRKAWSTVLGLAFASDTFSMATMEFADNAIMLVIPGAMDAGLSDPLFWGSLVVSLVLAGAAAFPVNRWLIARGKGHALVHAHHGH